MGGHASHISIRSTKHSKVAVRPIVVDVVLEMGQQANSEQVVALMR
jgi:hypothetical protein